MAESLIKPHLLSHGTQETQDRRATRRFLEEFLGIDVIRPLPEAQYMWKGGDWTVVCVTVDAEAKDQPIDNHFELTVGSAAEVDAAHAKALALKDEYRIRQVRDVVQDGAFRSFLLLDLNGTWWKISDVTQAYFDAAFARGDVA